MSQIKRPSDDETDELQEENQPSQNEDITPPKWQRRDDLRPLVSDLIEIFPDKLSHIRPVRIGYAAFSKSKSRALAKVYSIKPMYGLFSNIDYILAVWLENWVQETISKKNVLILHELLHIPAEGFDENSKQFRKTISHDIQDFEYVLSHFGLQWEEAEKILKMKKRKDDAKEETSSTTNNE